MTTKEEAMASGCVICCEAEFEECITPRDYGIADCTHYACRDCWSKAKRRCFTCRLYLPIHFPPKDNTKKYRDQINALFKKETDPLSITRFTVTDTSIYSHPSYISLMKNLTYLNLSGNRLENLFFLVGLNKLETLILNNTHINDISSLYTLTNIKTLIITNNMIKSLDSLKDLISLENLHLDFNKIVDISPLQRLTNLKILHLNNNQIQDVSPLTSLVNLKALGLDFNNIKNTDSISNILNLENIIYSK
jgi:Leucine-rich repeat (LRR) protein